MAKYSHETTSWNSSIDMEHLQQTLIKLIDDEYVTLRFNIGELARKISNFRKAAKQEFGKGSGAELGWKQHANSMYGVAASRHLVTNSVVLANVITATARAQAFAMQLSLNGLQVITDGCTYRRDQVPSATFAQYLEVDPEYPIRRVEAGISFHAADVVPSDDEEFTLWYRQNVKTFFGVAGSEYDALFGLHGLEHKACGDPARTFFDALCCDGSGNYVKLLREGEEWTIADFKARSFGKHAKSALGPWIVKTYSTDRYEAPPPITESPTLLSYKDAILVGRRRWQNWKRPDPRPTARKNQFMSTSRWDWSVPSSNRTRSSRPPLSFSALRHSGRSSRRRCTSSPTPQAADLKSCP
jgi:hypothetical protein